MALGADDVETADLADLVAMVAEYEAVGVVVGLPTGNTGDAVMGKLMRDRRGGDQPGERATTAGAGLAGLGRQTLVREFRGDGHLAVLQVAGVDPVEALIALRPQAPFGSLPLAYLRLGEAHDRLGDRAGTAVVAMVQRQRRLLVRSSRRRPPSPPLPRITV